MSVISKSVQTLHWCYSLSKSVHTAIKDRKKYLGYANLLCIAVLTIQGLHQGRVSKKILLSAGLVGIATSIAYMRGARIEHSNSRYEASNKKLEALIAFVTSNTDRLEIVDQRLVEITQSKEQALGEMKQEVACTNLGVSRIEVCRDNLDETATKMRSLYDQSKSSTEQRSSQQAARIASLQGIVSNHRTPWS